MRSTLGRNASRCLLGALMVAPWLAACTGDLDRGIRNMDIKGTGGDSTGDGSGGSPGSGGDTGSGGGTGSGGAIGTGGSGNSGSGGSSNTPCDAPTMVFQDPVHGCLSGGGATGCHDSGQAPDLSGSDVATMLKGMKASQLCVGQSYVDTSNPQNSVLYKIVDGTGCTIMMPFPPRPGPITSAQKACLADWLSKIQ